MLVNIVKNHYLTLGMTFFRYPRSLVQAGSAQLAREKSSRVLARGLAQTLAVRQTWTRERSAFCTPDWIPWTPDEVVVEVGRHRRLPAQLQTRPQQLKKAGGELRWERGGFEPSLTCSFALGLPAPAVLGASPPAASETCISPAAGSTTTRQCWGD